jgi:hypothetical protein
MEANFLRETFRQGRYCLHDASEVLKNRATARKRMKWLQASCTENELSSEKMKIRECD